jgi:hypothetical protein
MRGLGYQEAEVLVLIQCSAQFVDGDLIPNEGYDVTS